ncbi:MAG: RHS repeat-associated core domain-containing protein, partial [Bacteroidota bacterium]
LKGTYDYGFRIYNPALGRFLSVDPLTKGYPMLTPYQYASNTHIYAVDLDGLEGVSWSAVFKAFGVDIEINKRDSRNVEEEAEHQHELANGRARLDKLGRGLQKVKDGQEAVLSFVPGMSSFYSFVEGEYGEGTLNAGIDIFGGKIFAEGANLIVKGIGATAPFLRNAAKGLRGKGADILNRQLNKAKNIIEDHLGDSDVTGAIKDIFGVELLDDAGKPLLNKKGLPFDHLDEVTTNLSALKSTIKDIGSNIDNEVLQEKF